MMVPIIGESSLFQQWGLASERTSVHNSGAGSMAEPHNLTRSDACNAAGSLSLVTR